MDKYNVCIVAPVHIQPAKEWVDALKREAEGHNVIIVDDSNGKVELPEEWDIYGYERQEQELGPELYAEFEKYHKSSACRNFGHWVAYKKGYQIVIALDSDCTVPKDFVKNHVDALVSNSYGWVNPIEDTDWFPRGFPYHERRRPTACNMGLWENELDLCGIDRVVRKDDGPKDPMCTKQRIAHGLIPLCGMNTAFWSWAIPGMLYLPNFDDGSDRFRRHDDIWGGYVFQKLMQKRSDMITYGFPIVKHESELNANEDAKNEEAGIKWELNFYNSVDMLLKDVQSGNYESMFAEFAKKSEWYNDTVFKELVPAFKFWAKLFEPKNE